MCIYRVRKVSSRNKENGRTQAGLYKQNGLATGMYRRHRLQEVRTSNKDLDDFVTNIYIAVGILSVAVLFLIAAVTYLLTKMQEITASSPKKHQRHGDTFHLERPHLRGPTRDHQGYRWQEMEDGNQYQEDRNNYGNNPNGMDRNKGRASPMYDGGSGPAFSKQRATYGGIPNPHKPPPLQASSSSYLDDIRNGRNNLSPPQHYPQQQQHHQHRTSQEPYTPSGSDYFNKVHNRSKFTY